MQIQHTEGDYALIVTHQGPCGLGCCQTRMEVMRKVPVMNGILDERSDLKVVDGALYEPTKVRADKWDIDATKQRMKRKVAREAKKAQREADKAKAADDLGTMLREIGVTTEETVLVHETIGVAAR